MVRSPLSAKVDPHLLDEGVDLGARAPLAHGEQQDVAEVGPEAAQVEAGEVAALGERRHQAGGGDRAA